MKKINASSFIELLNYASINLENNCELINSLNVFPVPDGDTGSNMSMTFCGALEQISKQKYNELTELVKAFSKALLMNARGNSGVILSQIFRGFSSYIIKNNLNELNVGDFSNALVQGSREAYQAVIKPIEGTILTVIRESSAYLQQFVEENSEIDFIQCVNKLVEETKISLDSTPNLLVTLKEAGVVDSGGKGLLVIFEAFQKYFLGEELVKKEQKLSSAASDHLEDEFGYCSEFILKLNNLSNFNKQSFINDIEIFGNSLVVVNDEDIVKVHIHSLQPGNVLNFGQRYGEFIKIKIENMTEQHERLHDKTKQKYAIIAVSNGDGLSDYFKDLRVNYIVNGGQTNNPSTKEFVDAIQSLNAENIFILPNNSNIILAAENAQKLIEDKKVVVIPSKSMLQGINACLNFNPQLDLDDNIRNMMESLSSITSGQVTYAIKNSFINQLAIKKNQFIAIKEKEIIANSDNFSEVVYQLVDNIIDQDKELVYLIWGNSVDHIFAEELTNYIEDKYQIEVLNIQGNQPIYHLLIGAV